MAANHAGPNPEEVLVELNVFELSDPLTLAHLFNVAEGREQLTSGEQQAIAARILDHIESGKADDEILIAERNADGRHPIG
jgi:hypothetical protein